MRDRFRFVVEVGCFSDLLTETVCARFTFVKLILSLFLLPLIEPEYHGQSWYFTSRTLEFVFIIGQQ